MKIHFRIYNFLTESTESQTYIDILEWCEPDKDIDNKFIEYGYFTWLSMESHITHLYHDVWVDTDVYDNNDSNLGFWISKAIEINRDEIIDKLI